MSRRVSPSAVGQDAVFAPSAGGERRAVRPRVVTEQQRKNRRIVFAGLTVAAGYVFWPELRAQFGTENLILGMILILSASAALATVGYVVRRIAATRAGSFTISLIKVAIIAALGIMAINFLRNGS